MGSYPDDGAAGTAPSQVAHHFQRINALVNGGWLPKLTKTELAVWLVYHQCADGSGLAFPGASHFATVMGPESARDVRRARKQLMTRGLLERRTEGGGRAAGMFRVLVPGPADLADPTLITRDGQPTLPGFEPSAPGEIHPGVKST